MNSLARILCAIDLEKASERAFDRALSLAVIREAKLFFLHATPANVRSPGARLNGSST
jgi:nucleotide-binding universal stress UspA family protein